MGVSGQQHAQATLYPQEAGWAPGPVWMGRKSCPNWDSILDRPACSSAAIPAELPGPQIYINILFGLLVTL